MWESFYLPCMLSALVLNPEFEAPRLSVPDCDCREGVSGGFCVPVLYFDWKNC